MAVVFVINTASAQETLLLRSPSVSNDKIVFAYASNIWVANKDGSNPIHLTVNKDVEFEPVLSPDGKSNKAQFQIPNCQFLHYESSLFT